MRLHHLGYVGRDLQALSRRFLAEGAVAVSGPIEDPAQRVRVQFFREAGLGPGEDGVAPLWELVAPLGAAEDSPLAARLARGGGLDHVCFELPPGDGALEAALATERERGAQVVCEPVLATAFRRRIAFVFRRSGRLVELVEARPAGSTL